MSSFYDLFGEFIPDIHIKELKSVPLTKCDLNPEKRSLALSAVFDNYITEDSLVQVTDALKTGLNLDECVFTPTFKESAFTAAACEDGVLSLRRKHPRLNGYFNNAVYNLEGNKLIIELKFGGLSVVEDVKFEALLKKHIKIACFY